MLSSLFVFVPNEANAQGSEPRALYVGILQDIPDLNIFALWSNTQSKVEILKWAFEGLSAIDTNMLPYPSLAESWTFNEATLEVTVTLRSNVLFQDGYPMTADDVAFTYAALRGGTVYSAEIINAFDADYDGVVSLAEISSAVVVQDTYTVTMTMAHPYGQFFSSTLLVPIIPMHIWETHLTGDYTIDVYWNDPQATIGTGPFMYADGVDGVYRVMDKFPDYWGQTFYTPAGGKTYPPNIDQLYFKIYASVETAVLAIQSGVIDYLDTSIPSGFVSTLQADPNIGLQYLSDNGYFYLAFNEKLDPFGSLTFRQAVAHLVDKDLIINDFMGGYGVKGSSCEPPYWGVWFNESVETYPYDDPTDAASTVPEDLLDSAGFVDANGDGWRDLPDGTPMEQITILTPPADYDPIRIRAAQAIASNLRAVGINAEAQGISFDVLVARLSSMNYQMLIIGWSLNPEPVSNVFDILGPKSNQNTFGFWSVDDPNPFYKDLLGVNTLADAETQALAEHVDSLGEMARASFNPSDQILFTRWAQGDIAHATPVNVLYYRINIEAYRTAWAGWVPFMGHLFNAFSLGLLEYGGAGGQIVPAIQEVNAGMTLQGKVPVGEMAGGSVFAINATGTPVVGADVLLTAEGYEGGPTTVTLLNPAGVTNYNGIYHFNLTGDSAGTNVITVEVTVGLVTSSDMRTIEVVEAMPKTLYVSAMPAASVLRAGESTLIGLEVTDENGDPVEGATVSVDPYLISYGSVDSETVVTAADGTAAMTYFAPAVITAPNAHLTATLRYVVGMSGYEWAAETTTRLVLFNDAAPEWTLVRIESVSSTALVSAANSSLITVSAVDPNGNMLTDWPLHVTYSDASKVRDPITDIMTDGAGLATIPVSVLFGTATSALRVTISDTTTVSSASATVTLTYVGSTVPTEEMYGGYITYVDPAQYLAPMGMLSGTAWVWDSSGNPADGILASLLLESTAYGSLTWCDLIYWDTNWDYLGVAVSTSADDTNLALSGPMNTVFDYDNWVMWYESWLFWDWGTMTGVPITGGALNFDIYGMDVTLVDLISGIHVIPDGYGFFNETSLSYQIEGTTTISSEMVIGRAYNVVTATFDIPNPVMEARLSSYDTTSVDVLVTDENNDPVSDADVLVYENSLNGNTNYGVEPNSGNPRWSAPAVTDINGLASATITALPTSGTQTSYSLLANVYVKPSYYGYASVFSQAQIAIHTQQCEIMPYMELAVQNLTLPFDVTARVLDMSYQPVVGIDVGLSSAPGVVVGPIQATDAVGMATITVDASAATSEMAGFIPVTAYTGGPGYDFASATFMIPFYNPGGMPQTRLVGYITDYYTGDPIVDAMVEIVNATNYEYTYSDATGYYCFVLESGSLYDVYASASGYQNAWDTVLVMPGETTRLDLSLIPFSEPGSVRLYGYVTDDQTGYPVADAWIAVYDISTYTYSNWTSSGVDGAYEMYVIPEFLTVECTAVGYIPFSVNISTLNLTEYSLDILLESDSVPPELALSLTPNVSVSWKNHMQVHAVASDEHMYIVELAPMKLWNESGTTKNYTILSGEADIVILDPDYGYATVDYTFDGYNLTIDTEWDGRISRGAGWLNGSGAQDLWTMPSGESEIMGVVEWGFTGYYTDSTFDDVSGMAWFDNITGVFTRFTDEYGDLITDAGDPTAEFDPAVLNLMFADGVLDVYNTSAERLGYRSLDGLIFDYSVWALSGEYATVLLAADTPYNINMTVEEFTVDNDPPTADAGPDQTVGTGELVALDGSASSDNVGVTNYTWTFTDGTPKTYYGESFEYSFATADTYVITLTVRDDGLWTDADTVTITVSSGEDTEPPIADAGADQSVMTGTLVDLDGSGSSDNVGIESYVWTFMDVTARTLYSDSPSYRFDNAGDFVITLEVTDGAGLSDTDTVTIHVMGQNMAPSANAGSDQTANVGDTVTFNASMSMDDGGLANLNFTWHITDTTIYLYGVSPTHVFDEAGEYTVTLIVRDEGGLTDTDNVVITVEEEPPGETKGFVEQYWWLIAIAVVAAVAFVAFMLLKQKKQPAAPPPEQPPQL
jgi:ABC-type transport system substrate-binding protein/protocatechuate 3,4-dioxygenase beta subunit